MHSTSSLFMTLESLIISGLVPTTVTRLIFLTDIFNKIKHFHKMYLDLLHYMVH